MKHILLPLLVIGVVNSLFSTVPLLLWSSNSIESSHTVTQTLSGQHLQNLLSTFLSDTQLDSENPLQPYLKSSNPELLVLFVAPEVHTDEFIRFAGGYSADSEGGAFASLKTALQTAGGSVVVPYTEAPAVRTALASLRAPAAASTLLLETARNPQFHGLGTKLTKKQLLERLSNGADALHTNGVADLVLISLDTANGQPELIGEVNAALSGKNYVAAFTSAAVEHPLAETVRLERRDLTGTPAPSPNAPVPKGSRTPSSILEAGLILIVLLLIFFSGICCLKDVQTPQRFDTGKNIVVAE